MRQREVNWWGILVERGGGENGKLAPNIFEDGELLARFVVSFRFLCIFTAVFSAGMGNKC